MLENLVRVGRTLLFLSIGIFFLVIAFRDVLIEDLISGLLSAKYEWVILSLVLFCLAIISRTYRWILLIEPLGYKPSGKHTFYALMSGQLANFIFPRLGEITRCGSLSRTDKIPFDSLLGTVIIERLSDLIVLVILVLSVFFIKIDIFGDFLINNIAQPLYQTIFGWVDFHWFLWVLIASAALFILLFYRIAKKKLRGYKLYRKFENIAARVLAGMKTVMNMKKKIQFLLHTFIIWFMYYLMTAAFFSALPDTFVPSGSDVLFIMVVGGLGMAAPVQGGIGAYHWIVSVALSLYGISREDGLVYATLSHETQALLTILLGAFSLFMVFMAVRKSNNGKNILIPKQINLSENDQD